MKTLCIDIGGSGIKAILLDEAGVAISERKRLETPQPPVPDAVLATIAELVKGIGKYDRVSVGFPGVVIDGVTRTAHNLDPSWIGVDVGAALSKQLKKPVRVANDAGVQGLGVIQGQGVEAVITLGTGMGFGLYVDGKYVPNIELSHHPFRNGQSYEQRVGNEARKAVGNKKWNRRVRQVVEQIAPIFNYRQLYIGGGNTKHLIPDGFPENVQVVDNLAGLLGGIKLWT